MNFGIILFSMNSDKKNIEEEYNHLIEFKKYIDRHIKMGSELKIVNGNKNYHEYVPKIRKYIDTSCKVNNGNELKSIEAKTFFDKIRSSNFKFNEQNRNILIIDTKIDEISDDVGCHGIVNGELGFLIKNYKNIILHEAAHFFGIDDHYDKKTKRPIPGCKEKKKCTMLWNPKEKFCDLVNLEVDDYFKSKYLSLLKCYMNQKIHGLIEDAKERETEAMYALRYYCRDNSCESENHIAFIDTDETINIRLLNP